MKVFCQLTRRPIKTLLGIILVAAAVAVLSICMGQSIVIGNTEKSLDEAFDTVAVLSPEGYGEFRQDEKGILRFYLSAKVREDISDWLEKVSEENPDVVKTLALHGLASAYVPELIPDTYVQHNYRYPFESGQSYWLGYIASPDPEGAPYSCAMLEITLEEISEPLEKTNQFMRSTNPFSLLEGWRIEMVGKVESAVGLQENYEDPAGRIIRFTLPLDDIESWNDIELKVGDRYLIYGIDYFDQDWALRGIFEDRGILTESGNRGSLRIKEFDRSRFRWLSEEELATYQRYSGTKNAVAMYEYISANFLLEREEALMFNAVSLTLDKESFFAKEQNEYTLPTIARLEGSVEDFLESEAGTLWRETLDNIAVNNQAFPIIGVDKINYVTDFAKGDVTIVAGRDFTKEELSSGAKVCLISNSLARANGLEVGDVITPQFYNYDKNVHYQYFIDSGYGSANPAAYFYSDATPLQEKEVYVIVGLYQQNTEWHRYNLIENVNGFTTNTIFVPKTSVSAEMDYTDQGFFQTVILENGASMEFKKLAIEAGFDELFTYYDQGYTVIKDNLFNFKEVSAQAALTGLVIYGILLLLFLFLYPLSQKKTLTVMGRLGAGRNKRVMYIVQSGLGILVPGSVAGLVTGVLLWDRVMSALMASKEVVLDCELDVINIGAVVVVQFLLALVLTLVAAVFMIRKDRFLEEKEVSL